MNKLQVINNKSLESMIYEISGKQVMLDSDLAVLYGCKNGTKEINQAVARNKEKFPERFSWILHDEDSRIFLVTNCDQKIETRGGKYKNPRVFTEQGVAMLATILKTKTAVQTSIKIMDAFVAMRNYLSSNLIEQKYINSLVLEDHSRLQLLESSFNKLEEKKEVNEIYFDGKIYDAYSKIIDIFKEAKKELIIIDRYTDKTVLDMIKNLDVKVRLITSKKSKLTDMDIEKYNSTYNNLSIYYDDTYHDRFFIIDKNKIYHSGNSINHIGYRKSSIDILYDDKIKNTIIEDVNIIIKK